MYIIEKTNESVSGYFTAIAIAEKENCNVIDGINGLVRWRPPTPVSRKRFRMHQERKAARAAYEKTLKKRISA